MLTKLESSVKSAIRFKVIPLPPAQTRESVRFLRFLSHRLLRSSFANAKATAIFGAACFVCTAGLLQGGEPQRPDATTYARMLGDTFASIFDRVSPSVVVIKVERRLSEALATQDATPVFADEIDRFETSPRQNEGSGFVATSEGHLFTNFHVIEQAESITVRLKDGRVFPAKIVGTDSKTDIAVLKIDTEGLVPATLGDSDALRVGHLVCAIGAPYNLEFTLSVGCVSGKERSNFNAATFEEYIQTDAAINPGNSGGPLLDIDGRVVGMTSLVNGLNRGLGFAIPANMLREVGNELIRNGKVVRPWIGLGIDAFGTDPADIKKHPPGASGVIVRTLAPNSPAFESDLRVGDLVVKVDGIEVRTIRDLQRIVLKRKIGEVVRIEYLREGRRRISTLTTVPLPD